MHVVFESLPLVAAFLAVPQFLPQLSRVRRAWHHGGGVVVVGRSDEREQCRLAGLLCAVRLLDRAGARHLGDCLVGCCSRSCWPDVAAACRNDLRCSSRCGRVCCSPPARLFGRTGLGSALAVAFLLQVTPSVWTVYRSRDTTGVSRGTWLLIFGELLCWGVFGIHEADPRLIVLGATGVAGQSARARPRVADRRAQIITAHPDTRITRPSVFSAD